MTSLSIDRLFDTCRFPSGPALINIILYFPLGLILAMVRFFVGFEVYLLACILPKTSVLRSLILRPMCFILGLVVTQDGLENLSLNKRILVANYTTRFDYIAMQLVQPNVMVSIWDLPDVLTWLLGYHDFGAKHGRETLIQGAKKHCQESSIPLLAFPEGATTNGRAGLLKFSVWPFSLDQTVQPVAIQLSRPSMFEISPSLLGSHFWSDVFWFLFVPYTTFHIRYLPAEALGDDEAPQEFAKRVQTRLSLALGVQSTSHTSADKLDLIKRRQVSCDVRLSASTRQTTINSATSEVESMIDRVKNVLPNVPIGTIRDDLALTKDIDLTITNILEGRIRFVAEEPGIEADRETSPPPPPKSIPKHESVTRPALPNSSSTFGKSSRERQLSFEDRKKAMIDYARQRYLEKNNIEPSKTF